MPHFPVSLETQRLDGWTGREPPRAAEAACRTTVHGDHSFRCILSIRNPDFTQEERGTFGQGRERASKTDCVLACLQVARHC